MKQLVVYTLLVLRVALLTGIGLCETYTELRGELL